MEYITAEQAIEQAKGLTFEKVWAALMETRQQINQQIEASNQRSEKEMTDLRKQLAGLMEDSSKRSQKEMTELRKQLAGLGVSVGQQTETMFSNLCTKFNTYGYNFTGQAPHYKFYEDKRVVAEADYLLENGEYIMAVEVKTKLTEEDVDDHLERISIIRQHKTAHGDNRKIVGAVAGGIVAESTLAYAQKKGLYVLVQSGESVMIANLPDGFKAREW